MKIEDRIDKYLNERLGKSPGTLKGSYIGYNDNESLFRNLKASELKREHLDNSQVRILVDVLLDSYYISNSKMFHDSQINLLKKIGIHLSDNIIRIRGKITGNVLTIDTINNVPEKSHAFKILQNHGFEVKE